MEREAKAPAEKRVARQPKKKAYVSPKLTVHGDVGELTKLVGGQGADGYGGSEIF